MVQVLTRAAVFQGQEQKIRFMKSAEIVTITSFKIFFAGVLVMVFNIGFGVLSTGNIWREFSPPNSLSVVDIFGFFASLSVLVIVCIGQVYLSATVAAAIQHSSSKEEETQLPTKTRTLL